MGRKTSSRRILLIALVVFVLVSWFVAISPTAHALVTVNTTRAASGSATQFPSERKVYYANNLWWVFYATTTQANGITCESSPDGVTWSAPTTISSAVALDTVGSSFSSWLVGSTLYYVLSPATNGQNFYFGAANLGASASCAAITWYGAAHDAPHAIAHYGTSNPRVSVVVDGSATGDLWIAITTDNTAGGAAPFYVDVFQCKPTSALPGGVTSCVNGGGATWLTSSYTLATGAVADLTVPSLFPAYLNPNYFVELIYVDAASGGGAPGYGPVDISYAQVGLASITFSAQVHPSGQFYHMFDYGAVAYTPGGGPTITYFAGIQSGWDYEFGYTIGQAATTAENIVAQAANIPALSMYGSTLIFMYPTGGNIAFTTSVNGGVTWSAVRNIAQNTESGSSWVEASPNDYVTTAAACPPQDCIGVIWENSGSLVRFATLSLTNFPVSVSLSLIEYQNPQTAWYPLCPVPQQGCPVANYFQITFTQCTGPPATPCSTFTTGAFGQACGALGVACYSSNSGAVLTISNIESYTLLTIASTSSASTATERWCLNIGNSGVNGACGITQFGSSDGLPATVTVGGVPSNTYLQYWYYNVLAEPTHYSVIPAAPAPPAVPTIHYSTAPGGSSSPPYISTGSAPSVQNQNLQAAATTYWMLRNSTAYASQSISGAPNEQWAANPSVAPFLAWTITAANQINNNIAYYHQFLNFFQMQAAFVNFDSQGVFVLSATQYGVFGVIQSFVGTGGSNVLPALPYPVWSDATTTVSFPQTAANEPASTNWAFTSCALCAPGTRTTPPLTLANSGTNYKAIYYEQFLQTLSFRVSDGSGLPTSPPQIMYSVFGVFALHNLNASVNNVFIDAATTATVTQTYCTGPCGAATERWFAPTATWLVNGANVITNPSIVWYHQFLEPMSYSSTDAKPLATIPQITFTSAGVTKAHNLNLTTDNDWLDATEPAFLMVNPICTGPCVSATEQWYTGTFNWPAVTGANQIPNPIAFLHQYQITFMIAAGQFGDGTIDQPLPGCSLVSGCTFWETATHLPNIPALGIDAAPSSGWLFDKWTVSPNIVLNFVNTQASNTVTINGAGTITAGFTVKTGLTFLEQGITNFGGNTWEVDVTWPDSTVHVELVSGSSLNYGTPALGNYRFVVPTPQMWGAGTRYAVTGANCSGAISACSVTLNSGTFTLTGTGSITITFQPQYVMVCDVVPANGGTVDASPSPTGFCDTSGNWYPGNSIVTLTAIPNAGLGAVLDTPVWSNFACSSIFVGDCTTPIIEINMSAPYLTVQANFLVPLSIDIAPSTITAVPGTGVGTIVTVTGGYDMITLSASPPAGITLSYSGGNPFAADASGYAQTVTVNIPSNDLGPAYTFQLTATDTNGLAVSGTITILINKPVAVTVGYTTTPFAITFASQQADFFCSSTYCGGSGSWFVFYSDGHDLVYKSSSDPAGVSWTGATVLVRGINQGYSFAVGNNGSNVYLALITSLYPNGFWFTNGQAVGQTINWDNTCVINCAPTGTPLKMYQVPACQGGCAQLVTAGSPTILVDKYESCKFQISGACVWVTVPALDNNLQWHVEIEMLGAMNGNPLNWNLALVNGLCSGQRDVCLHTYYTATQSVVHAQLFNMKDGLAALFSVGNTPHYPHITVVNRATSSMFTAPTPNWGVLFYEQQSQAMVQPGSDTLFFVGLATTGVPGAGVYYFSFTYDPIGPVGTYNGPSQITPQVSPIGQAQIKNHSWHISLAYSSSDGNVYLAYGIDNSLFGLLGTISGNTITWAASPTPVGGVSGLLNGVTIAATGGPVGVVWVQTLGSAYAVMFAII